MSFLITIAQRKGGAGKTTLTCQLAAAFAEKGLRVTGIDADPQGSLSQWAARRDPARPAIECVDFTASSRFRLSNVLYGRRAEADIILIDTPPNTSDLVKTAIKAADLVLTPLQLSPLDLDATLPTAQMIGEAGRPSLFVINRAPPRARIADAIRATIKKQQLPLASIELGNRAAYSESVARGLGVVESAPSSKPAQEIRQLTDEIYQMASMRKSA